MITADEYARFEKLRADLFDAIALSLSKDGHCKHYEGRLTIVFPHYFHERAGDDVNQWQIQLDCYVIGPSRHYDWDGATFLEALQKAETDIRAWMHEAQEDE